MIKFPTNILIYFITQRLNSVNSYTSLKKSSQKQQDKPNAPASNRTDLQAPTNKLKVKTSEYGHK